MTINNEDDVIAGSLLVTISAVEIVIYLFILRAIYRVAKNIPTFLIFFSQGIGEIGLILNIFWLGIDILIGPTIMFKSTKIYSIAQNMANRPTLYHYVLVACVRLCAVRFPNFFNRHATTAVTTFACVSVWLIMWCEVVVLHIPYPVDAYINHNIQLYAITSLNLTVYFSSPLPTYFNVHNIFVCLVCSFCYLCCAITLRSLAADSWRSREMKMLTYCLTTTIVLFTPTLIRLLLTNSSKWTLLGTHLFRSLTYFSGAVLLPLCSRELRSMLHKRKSVQSTTAADETQPPQVAAQNNNFVKPV